MNRSGIFTALLSILVLSILSGCATMAGWVGIASSESVDQLGAEVGSLQGDLQASQAKIAQIEGLSRSMEEVIRATEELQQLAEIMESRLQQMPRDTIQELVDILQRYLEGGE